MLADGSSGSGLDWGDAVDSRAEDGGNVLGPWNHLGSRAGRDREKRIARLRATPGVRHVVGLLLLNEILVTCAAAFPADVIGAIRKREMTHRFDVDALSEHEPKKHHHDESG